MKHFEMPLDIEDVEIERVEFKEMVKLSLQSPVH